MKKLTILFLIFSFAFSTVLAQSEITPPKKTQKTTVVKPKPAAKPTTKTGKISPRPIPSGYVDLGLPSGTLWKKANEYGYYFYNEAVSKYGNNLPTKKQWEELKDNCVWTWNAMKKGYTVKGKSGNSIFLPAEGLRYYHGGVGSVGSHGYYWSSSTPNGSEYTWDLYLDSGGVYVFCGNRCCGQSVRLVKD